MGASVDANCAFRSILDKKIYIPLLLILSSIVLEKGFEVIIYILFALFAITIVLLLNYHIQKNESCIPVILFILLLLSPLIPTGFPLKKYMRLNEIFLIIVLALLFANNTIKGVIIRIKQSEFLLFLVLLSLLISIHFGYLFLDIIPSTADYSQVFNIILFILYFRFGTFFNYKNKNTGIYLKIIFMGILALNIISIIQITPWGFENITSLYMTPGNYDRFSDEKRMIWIPRLMGMMETPTSFSIILVIIIIMIVGWNIFMKTGGGKYNYSLYILLILTMLTLTLTFSRSGFLALMTSMAYFLGVTKFQHKRKITRIIIFFLSFFLSVGSILLIVGALFDIDIDQMRGFRLDSLFGGGSDTSHVGTRLDAWQRGLAKGMISPVFGWGLGTANNLQAELTGDTTIRAFYSPHNEFIFVFLTTGLVGLVLFLSFFVGIFRKTNAILKKNHDKFCIYMSRSVQAIMVGIAFFCLGDGIWFNATIPSLLMLIFGAMYATDKASSHSVVKK
jgi:hypothetical protein